MGRRRSRQQQHAEATRRDILAAARRLFAARGYAATSMTALAEEADVALQTLYTSVGSKPAILMALNDLIDEEGGVTDPALAEQFAACTDPRDAMKLYIRLTRQISERCGDIVWTMIATAGTEPEVAKVVEDGWRRHDTGAREAARQLADGGALRPGLSVDQAAAILGSMTWHQHYRQLVEHYGWSFDACEAWLVEACTELLTVPPAH